MKRIISMILAAIMCFSLVTVSFAAEFKFTDVKSSDWFYNDVKSAVEMGLVNGKSDTRYAPDDNLTYAEAIKLAACMSMLYTQGEVNIKAGTPWYKPYVDYCVEYNIIDREYDYDAYATRAGYMGIFAKALPEEGFGVINNVPDDSIPDVPSKASYAPGIYKLYRAGILTGVDAAHNCKPLANITRAEVAAILTRIMNEGKRVSITDMAKEEIKEEEKKEEPKEEVKKEEIKEEPKTEEKEEPKEEVKKEETKEEPKEEVKKEEPKVEEKEEPAEEKVEPLKIKSQPEDTEVTVRRKATFKVEVTGGKEPYKYLWKADDSGIGMFSTITTGEMFANTTTDEIQVIWQKTSEYKIDLICVIMDANGDTVTTDKFTLTAKPTPLVITEQPKSIEDASYEKRNDVWCNVEGGEGDYRYVWEYDLDGVWLSIDSKMKEFTPSANGLNFAPQKAGTYKVRCVITVGQETVTTDVATITAKEPPVKEPAEPVVDPNGIKIETQPQNISVMAKNEAVFTVTVKDGTAPYKYQWQVSTNDGDFVNIREGNPSYSGVKTDKLTINATAVTYDYLAEKHLFRCVITDAKGVSVTSDEAKLTEDYGPSSSSSSSLGERPSTSRPRG